MGGEGHELRLHVGGEAGIFFGVEVGGGERIVSHDADGRGGGFGFDAGRFEFADDGVEVSRIAGGDVEVAAG